MSDLRIASENVHRSAARTAKARRRPGMRPARLPFSSEVVDVFHDESADEHAGELQLRLKRIFATSPERLFAAFTDADELRQWWGPASFTVPHLQFTVAEGARYRITMQPPDGDAFHLGGTFCVVEAPRRLVFTFAWEEPDPDDQETLITLRLESAGEGTILLLDQQPFKTEQRWELHRAGWTDTLERLSRFLN